jgi:hypothetical protein
VSGQITDSRFEIKSDQLGGNHLYEVAYCSDRSVLRPVGDAVTCGRQGASTWSAGDWYEVPSNAFHESRADEASITVVESGAPIGSPPLVVGSDVRSEVRYERNLLDASELEAVVAGLV